MTTERVIATLIDSGRAMAPGEIAGLCSVPLSDVVRAVSRLRRAGVIEQHRRGLWRLSRDMRTGAESKTT